LLIAIKVPHLIQSSKCTGRIEIVEGKLTGIFPRKV
jgi:hypothetical protein